MEILKRSFLLTTRNIKTNDTKNELNIKTKENTGTNGVSKKLSVSTKLDEILKVDDGVTSVDSKNSKTDYSEYTRSEINSSKKSVKSLSPSPNSPLSIQHSGGLHRQYELSSLPSPPRTNETHIPNLSPITPAQSSRSIKNICTIITPPAALPLSSNSISDSNKNKVDINQLHLLTHEPHPNSYSIFSPTRPINGSSHQQAKDRVVSTLNPDEMSLETNFYSYSIFSPTRPISSNRLYFINDNNHHNQRSNSVSPRTTNTITAIMSDGGNAIVNNTISPREGSRSRSYSHSQHSSHGGDKPITNSSTSSSSSTTTSSTNTSTVSRRPSLSSSIIYLHSTPSPSASRTLSLSRVKSSSSSSSAGVTGTIVLPAEEFVITDGIINENGSALTDHMSKMKLDEDNDDDDDDDDDKAGFHVCDLLSPRSPSHSPTRLMDDNGDDCFSPVTNHRLNINTIITTTSSAATASPIATATSADMLVNRKNIDPIVSDHDLHHHPPLPPHLPHQSFTPHYPSSTLSSLRSTPGSSLHHPRKMSRLDELKLLDKALLAAAMQDETMLHNHNNDSDISGNHISSSSTITTITALNMKNKSSYIDEERENKIQKHSSESSSSSSSSSEHNHLTVTTLIDNGDDDDDSFIVSNISPNHSSKSVCSKSLRKSPLFRTLSAPVSLEQGYE